MTAYQVVFLLFAVSLPIVVLVVVGCHIVSAFRSLRGRRVRFALFSVLAIAGILLVFVGVGVVWFGYGLGHSKKEMWEDLLLIIVSAAPIYGGGYGLWRLARYIDTKSIKDVV